MDKKYMVVAFGTGKTSKKKYSRAFRMKEDIQKGAYGYLDEKDQFYTEDFRPLGSIIKVKAEEV